MLSVGYDMTYEHMYIKGMNVGEGLVGKTRVSHNGGRKRDADGELVRSQSSVQM